jgi:cytochrome c553
MKTRIVPGCRWLALTSLGLVLVAGPVAASTPAEIAQAEYEEVLALTPNPANGHKAYITCAVCHRPEGWGTLDGTYPQIAGQHRTVIIKQLADIRARNRDNPLMYPFSVPRVLGGPQNIADVAAYLAQLPMNPHNGVGPGTDLELGARLYQDHCVKCHGDRGQGDEHEHVPAVAGQHFNYLVRQFDAIRDGRRRNSDPKMVEQIKGMAPREEMAVLDYTSRLRPPAERLGAADWRNPDFRGYVYPSPPATETVPGLPATPAPTTPPRP